MDLQLNDRVVIVTGAAAGIGGRIDQPDDVARVIAYLISPLSSQVTGAEWVVDGGALPQI